MQQTCPMHSYMIVSSCWRTCKLLAEFNLLWRLVHQRQRRRRRLSEWKPRGSTRAWSVARVTWRSAVCWHIWDIIQERGRSPASSVIRRSFNPDICHHTCGYIPASDVTPATSVENGLEPPATWRYSHWELKMTLFFVINSMRLFYLTPHGISFANQWYIYSIWFFNNLPDTSVFIYEWK